jgi:hypothetical protein
LDDFFQKRIILKGNAPFPKLNGIRVYFETTITQLSSGGIVTIGFGLPNFPEEGSQVGWM